MSYETNDKMVSHPDHYKSGKYEVIDIIDEFTKDLSGTEAVCTANAIKYILRWKKKNGIQDVKKAIWYLQHMVDKEEERLQEEHAAFDEERLEKMEEDPEEDLEVLTCKECGYFIDGMPCGPFCSFIGYKVTPDQVMCACFEEKSEKKFEPGCDKCEISECKFLEDPFMNPPYNELWTMWKNQKENINKLMREKKELQDSIDILEDDKNNLEQIVAFQKEEIKELKDIITMHGSVTMYGKYGNDPTCNLRENIRNCANNTGFVNGLKKANKQLAEDFNNKANNIHSCDDCIFKANEPFTSPCKDCDLHQTPPTNWVARD